MANATIPEIGAAGVGTRHHGLLQGISALGLAAATVNAVISAGHRLASRRHGGRAAGPHALVAYFPCALAMSSCSARWPVSSWACCCGLPPCLPAVASRPDWPTPFSVRFLGSRNPASRPSRTGARFRAAVLVDTHKFRQTHERQEERPTPGASVGQPTLLTNGPGI